MTLAEYDQRWNALLSAWQALHRATDTPESAAAVRAAHGALRALGVYAVTCGEAQGSGRAAEESAALALAERMRADGVLAEAELEALRALAPRVRDLAAFTAYSESRDRACVLLVSQSLPGLWRMVQVLQDELRAQRPARFYFRRARRIAAGVAVVAAVILAAQGARVAHGLWRDDGWRVTYFYSAELKRPLAVRGEPVLNRTYGARAPAFPIRRDRWSARWDGRLRIDEAGDYTFVVQGNDGYRFYINGELLLDSWREQSWQGSFRKVSIRLAPGLHPVRVEHFDHLGDAAIRVRWSGGPIPRDTPLGAPHVRKP